MVGLRGDGYTVLGATLRGPEPIGCVFVPFSPGLHVLYGLNGAGKTRLLSAIESVCAGRRTGRGGSALHIRFDDPLDAPISQLERHLVWLMSRKIQEADRLGEDALEEERQAVEHGVTSGLVQVLLSDEWSHVRPNQTVDDATTTEGLFTLEAVGTSEEPRWKVWASVSPEVAAVQREYDRVCAAVRRGGIEALLEDPSLIATLPRAFLDAAGTGEVERPAWVPHERLEIGDLDGPAGFDENVVHVLTLDASVDELNRETFELIASYEDSLFADEAAGVLDVEPESVRHGVSSNATRRIQSLLGSELMVDFVIGTARDHLPGGPGSRWVFVDEYGARFPLEAASSSRLRWCVAAIESGLRGADLDTGAPTMVITDEPERGFHRQAERRIVEGLVDWGSEGVMILAASHAPEFLTHQDVNRWRIHRDPFAELAIEPSPGLGDADLLGLDPADVFTLTRLFIVVEGEHDKIVLQALLDHDLGKVGVEFLVLRGASKLKALTDAEWLLRASDAAFLVVLDKIDDRINERWKQALAAYTEGELDRAHELVATIKTLPPGSPEQGHLASFGRTAIERAALARVHLVGLSKDDILDYLDDPTQLAKLKARDQLPPERIRDAIPQDRLHPDLAAVLAEVDHLVRRNS